VHDENISEKLNQLNCEEWKAITESEGSGPKNIPARQRIFHNIAVRSIGPEHISTKAERHYFNNVRGINQREVNGLRPDVVFTNCDDVIVAIAEVESEEPFRNIMAQEEMVQKWQGFSTLNLPFYLFVMDREPAQTLAERPGILITKIKEYCVGSTINGLPEIEFLNEHDEIS
jgi:hypothetical protein